MQHNLFSEAEILEGIVEWAEIESPTYDPARVATMVAHVEGRLSALGAATETLEISPDYAPALRARFPGKAGAEGGGILVLGHLDTVHPEGTTAGPLKIRVEGDRLYGPGVFDMKGGFHLAYYAMKKLLQAGLGPNLPVTFLCIPEEEIGSPASRDLIEEEAKKHSYVLVPEPSRKGCVITGRHAFVRYRLTTHGLPAHAGADNLVGRSAIRAMAKLVETIEGATDMDRLVSFSVGVISGGKWVNVIPITCEAEVLAVASSEENLAYVYDFMAGLESPLPEVTLEVEKGPERPLFKPHPGTLALYEKARAVAGDIGFALEHGQFGGGSDGNFTGALEIPTLDGLGVCGAGAHTHGEHLLISSLVPRARLLAGLLCELD
ncbi:MAG: M20/M25/M40 family metallo-hydrolase [Rhodospirillales bacterium]